MPLGPFDSRNRRSRCSACSASHLKCSAEVPCSNCSRRRIACTYTVRNTAKPLILVERGKQKTTDNWVTKADSSYPRQHQVKSTRGVIIKDRILASPARLIDETSRYLSFFDAFVKRNNFTGKARTAGDEVRQLAEFHSRRGKHVLDAILAIGGIYAGKLNLGDATARREMRIVAYQHYSYSIDGLREAIDASHIGTSRQPRKSQDEIVSILWTTFFLGIFELMNDSTGHGWQQHIIHGTFMAMKASGPSSCRSMAGMAFFAQARIFEISRTILFNEPTFLTGPEWMALSRDLSIKGNPVETQNPWLPLDSLLDIMVMCSDLRVRAATFIQKQQNTPDAEATSEAIAISTNGYLLREALINWSSAYIPDQLPINNTRETPSCDNLNNDHPGFGPQNSHEVAADMSKLLARIFYASISIYLSGVFDYELFYWQHLRLIVPTLDEILIEQHLNTILALTELGLNRTDLSPLLFLFPLRIAGARSCQQWQRDKISALVAHVNKLFAVAAAIDNDLATVWKLRAVVQNPM